MKTLLYLAFVLSCTVAGQAASKPSTILPRSTPEAQGISSDAVLDFVRETDQKVHDMHSFMLLRHGKVVAEGWWTPYDSQTRHALYSLSKSFTSTAVGLAIAEGKLSLDDEVLKFFPEDAPAQPSDNLKNMRVRDLIRMGTGHQKEPVLAGSPVWTKAFLAEAVPHKPGTHFMYNTPATYMLSAIVQKTTGSTVLDYLKPRLFDPIGIENPTWGTSPQGVSLGGYGLSIRTEDIARFGQLYLQQGKWQGQQLVPAKWVAQATSLQIANGSRPTSDWDQGYGFQFWRCRNGAFRGDGAFGQYCLVMPEQDAVLAITSGTKDMQNVLNIVWDKLLPAMKPGTLARNETARKQLEETLSKLTIPAQTGERSSTIQPKVAGKKFTFPANDQKIEAITLEQGQTGSETTLVVRCDGKDQRIVCGPGAWTKGHIAYGTQADQLAGFSGGWTSPESFALKICFYETPFILSAKLTFQDQAVTYDAESNVGFGAARKPQLIGKLD